ncbi:MAG: hypothetical protein J6T35_02450 [Bacteroidales bacterium]|nr:hypothetical protein [Bacteroidales bacterium]
MTNKELVTNMYEHFKEDAALHGEEPEKFSAGALQAMLMFAYDLLDRIETANATPSDWARMKAGIIKNHGEL